MAVMVQPFNTMEISSFNEVWADASGAFFVDPSNSSLVDSTFHWMVARSLGLCVPVSPGLWWTLHVNSVVQVVLSGAGMAGASVSLVVTCLARRTASSLSLQVSVLSVYNLVFLTSVLVLGILRLCDLDSTVASDVLDVLRALGLWGVSYTMVDITVDRCLFIARPFLAKKICGVGFTLKKSAAVLCTGVCFVLPFVLDLVLVLSTDPSCSSPGERKLTVFGVVYTLYLSILFFYLVPFVCIVIANVVLIHALCQFGKHAQVQPVNASAQAESSARQLSFFVMVLCAWYSGCMLAPSILFLVRLSRSEVFEPDEDITVASAADTLVVLSSAANFLIYCLMWKNFRQAFLSLFCHRCSSCSLSHGSREGCTVPLSHSGERRAVHIPSITTTAASGPSESDSTVKL